MYQLIYASTAARALDEETLEALVTRARDKNARLGITGVLVYRNGSFLHVMEGEDAESVRALYETIRADDRHRWVTVLKASALDERDFPDQPLAFRNRSVAGARASLTNGEATPLSSSARQTLAQFQQVEEAIAEPPHASSGSSPPSSSA